MGSSNKIRDAFDHIGAGEELKASTRDFLYAARQKEERAIYQKKERKEHAVQVYPTFRRMLMLGAACAIMTVLLGVGGYTLLLEPVAYVSIDVNPSLELALNRFDHVISVTAYNEEGENILKSASVSGKTYMDAIDLLMESEAMQPYLAEDAALTFTVAAGNGKKEKILLSGIDSCYGCRNHGGVSYSADIGILSIAHENGLSLGKYAAYSVLSEYDDSITMEDCHNMTMSEIHGLIEAHTHGNGSGHEKGSHLEDADGHGTGHESGHDTGHGSCHGTGHGSGHKHSEE